MKKKVLSLLLASTMVLSMAACGSSEEAPAANPVAEPVEPGAEPAPVEGNPADTFEKENKEDEKVKEDDEEGTEEDAGTEEFVPETFRTLDFNPFELSGYYNLPEVPVRLDYVLYVKMPEAEEFIEAKTGYFSAGDSVEPTVVNAGDIITFDVKYTGTVTVTDGVKFIVNGRKDTVGTGLDLGDYNDAEVKEDK